MKYSQTPGMYIRRVRILPVMRRAIPSRLAQDQKNGEIGKNPLIIRRSYDVTASCVRQNDEDHDAPLTVHIRGERATPLAHVVTVGAAAVGIALSAWLIVRMRREWSIRRKYAIRYAERLKAQRYRMQSASDAKG